MIDNVRMHMGWSPINSRRCASRAYQSCGYVQSWSAIEPWGRATYGQRYPDLLTDPHAEEIIAQLDYDLGTVFRAFGEAD